MKNLQFNPYQCGAGWGEDGRVGSKKSKPIPAPLHGARLKSRPHSCPTKVVGGENPCRAKGGEAGQAGQGRIAIPSTS